MIKVVVLTLLLLIPIISYSQSKPRFKIGPIISLKAGYHTKDSKDEYSMYPYDNTIPAGFCIDATAEIPTGKSWYVGLNYGLSFAQDTRYDVYQNYDITRSFVIYNFSPLVKYRYFADKVCLNFGIGIGSSKIVISYDRGSLSESKYGLLNLSLRFGVDYALNPQLLFTTETVFYGMSELSFHGSGRSNSIFEIKAGVGYVLK